MLDGRLALNLLLAAITAFVLSTLLSGCAVGAFTGPSTLRCTGGATAIHYAPDYQKFECGGELVVTGSLSDNATTLFGGLAAFAAGLLVSP